MTIQAEIAIQLFALCDTIAMTISSTPFSVHTPDVLVLQLHGF
jgi:sialic acid synthase SpsE